MNKRGQTMGIAILSSIIIFLVGMICINFILDDVTNARINLSCDSPSTISDGTKLTCLFVDTAVPYFIWLVFSIAIGAIIARLNV